MLFKTLQAIKSWVEFLKWLFLYDCVAMFAGKSFDFYRVEKGGKKMSYNDRSFRKFAKEFRRTCRFKNDPHGRVINLSRHKFSINVFQLLNKGLSFCPRPIRFNNNMLKNDEKSFFRRIRFRAHFGLSNYKPIVLDSTQRKKNQF